MEFFSAFSLAVSLQTAWFLLTCRRCGIRIRLDLEVRGSVLYWTRQDLHEATNPFFITLNCFAVCFFVFLMLEKFYIDNIGLLCFSCILAYFKLNLNFQSPRKWKKKRKKMHMFAKCVSSIMIKVQLKHQSCSIKVTFAQKLNKKSIFFIS